MTLASDLSSGLSQTTGTQWVSVVCALLGGPVGRLLGIGTTGWRRILIWIWPNASSAWIGSPASFPTLDKIEVRAGNFLDMDIAEGHGPASFDLALALCKKGHEA